MDFRPFGRFLWPFVSLASIINRSYIGKGEDAGRSCLLCAEACRQGWKTV